HQHRQPFLTRGHPRGTDTQPAGPRLSAAIERGAHMHPSFMHLQNLQIEFGKLRVLIDLDVVPTRGSIGNDTVAEHDPDVAGREIGVQALLQRGDCIRRRDGLAPVGTTQMVRGWQGEYLSEALPELPQALAVTTQAIPCGTVPRAAAGAESLGAATGQ